MGDEVITTDVDDIIDILKENERMELNELAEKTGLNVRVIENWAKLLEEQNLARIEQKLTKSYIVWSGESKILQEVGGVEDDISRLESIKNEMARALADSTQRIGKTTQTLEKIEEELAEYVKSAKSKTAKKSDKIRMLEQLVSKIRGADEEVDAHLKTAREKIIEETNAANEIEENLKQAKSFSAEINGEIENAKALLKEETRKITVLENELGELKKVDDWITEYRQECEEKFEAFSKYVEEKDKDFKKLKKLTSEPASAQEDGNGKPEETKAAGEAQAHIEEALKSAKSDNGELKDEFAELFQTRKKKPARGQ